MSELKVVLVTRTKVHPGNRGFEVYASEFGTEEAAKTQMQIDTELDGQKRVQLEISIYGQEEGPVQKIIKSNWHPKLTPEIARFQTVSLLEKGAQAVKRFFLNGDLDVQEFGQSEIGTDLIKAVVCEFYGLELNDMTSRRRPERIAHPRQMAMYLSREFSGLSLVEIGQQFGGRDHGTVIHATKKVIARFETDQKITKSYESIRAEILRRHDATEAAKKK